MSRSDTLFRRLQLVAPALDQACARIAISPGLAELYPEYLRVCHGIVRASVPLMAEACRTLRDSGPDPDPLTPELLRYFTAHIAEEQGHDEWVLEDLDVLGVERTWALDPAPPRRLAEVVGAQYYWIRHHHPVALLGYILVLEGYPPSFGYVEAMIERSGLPRAAFRTMLGHAGADVDHVRELRALLDSLPLTDDQLSLVSTSALATAYGLTEVFDDLVAGRWADGVAERPAVATVPSAGTP